MSGEELLIQLRRRGLKQKDLAGKLGLTHAMVSYYVRGRQPITPERETEIWRALEELSAERLSLQRTGTSDVMSAQA